MKLLLTFLVILITGCHESSNNPTTHNSTYIDTQVSNSCNLSYDSLLIRYSTNFRATAIDLDKCLSQELRSFILKVDTNCLMKQQQYKNFIAIILAKLYRHHLQCCNQGYDLLSMKSNAAGIIINEFEKLAGYYKHEPEILISGSIMDYIDNEQSFQNNKSVKELRKDIEKEEKRIAIMACCKY